MTKRPTRKKRGSAASSKLALMAGMLAAPALMISAPGMAQQATTQPQRSQPQATTVKAPEIFMKFAAIQLKVAGMYDIAGTDGGHTVFVDMSGRKFWLDPMTGDMKFLPKDKALGFLKTPGKVTILGMDARGNVIQQNSKGEKFYLDAAGTMIVVVVK